MNGYMNGYMVGAEVTAFLMDQGADISDVNNILRDSKLVFISPIGKGNIKYYNVDDITEALLKDGQPYQLVRELKAEVVTRLF